MKMIAQKSVTLQVGLAVCHLLQAARLLQGAEAKPVAGLLQAAGNELGPVALSMDGRRQAGVPYWQTTIRIASKAV